MEINYTPKNYTEVMALANLSKAMINKGFDLKGYGFFDKNPICYNLYLWLEDCPITPFCKPNSTEVEWCYSCGNCGDEIIGTYSECMIAYKHEEKHGKCETCK